MAGTPHRQDPTGSTGRAPPAVGIPAAPGHTASTGSVRQLLLEHSDNIGPVLDKARAALSAGHSTIPEAEIRLGPPVPDPDKILCLGLNFEAAAA